MHNVICNACAVCTIVERVRVCEYLIFSDFHCGRRDSNICNVMIAVITDSPVHCRDVNEHIAVDGFSLHLVEGEFIIKIRRDNIVAHCPRQAYCVVCSCKCRLALIQSRNAKNDVFAVPKAERFALIALNARACTFDINFVDCVLREAEISNIDVECSAVCAAICRVPDFCAVEIYLIICGGSSAVCDLQSRTVFSVNVRSAIICHGV